MNNFLNNGSIRVSSGVILMNEFLSLKNILPSIDSLVDAKIGKNGGWTSGDA